MSRSGGCVRQDGLESEGATHRTRRPARARLGVVGLGFVLLAAVTGLAWDLAWRYEAALPGLDLAAASARSTVVLDRSGALLRPFATADGRWRLPVTAGTVDLRYRAMLLAYEDRRFAHHPGIDPLALLRAAGQWLIRGRIVSGGSTLSMQVARLVEPRHGRTLAAKLRQMARAVTLERRLGKAGLLDLYLALAPYGGPLEGVRAASLAYFGREPVRLTAAQAALLVALPQSPEARRPDRFPDRARAARDRVLEIAGAQGLLSAAEVAAARAEPVPTARHPFPMLAAHAAEEAVAAEPAAPEIRLAIDARLQERLEVLAAERAAAAGPDLSAAILVLDNRDGRVLAQVGSAGYLDSTRRGAIDMTRAVRSPGSALKPFVYALAFEDGLAHPETLLEDRPARFAASYAPENFDLTFQGTVTARRALQLSLNVPAVELMEAVGPARFIARLRAAGTGIQLPREAAPGLPVALGGLGITLTDLARLYAGLARGGTVPELLRRVGTDAVPSVHRIAEPVAAWYVADILRGTPPPENALSNRIAYKTGTSYGYRDAWAAGFDRHVTVVAWVGRPDGAAVPGLVGRTVAAPILFDAFARLGIEPEPVPQPRDVLAAGPGGLPPPLRRLGRETTDASGPALRIAYPPDGARIDLGLVTPGGTAAAGGASLALKALGGVPPLTWLVDGQPVAQTTRRRTEWSPEGAGFARISVLDATGASASVSVRLE
ncbi:penicillin-binding protein 1C [Methylobacterium mesophilicum SR1.6/6]|uniref:peptidoglycan glycosyltransferase n=1 Tax=Methylobacterium mesophilicum SR1.6/6 TaxID=908290 RepID=A0A6B9FN71_9HYPH|nr:penicillin-binding protein 1C [Methylobacterium mesophilicum]QGY04030.1 penicillin-binding protein 1C [Methylobacterium mesophilicum SR1.6/6]